MNSTPRIVCFGEVLLRLTASDLGLLLQRPELQVCVGGAEANVAVSIARLGGRAVMASILPDNALGHCALQELRAHGVDVENIALHAGRMGLYFFTPGALLRPSEVLYDRAASAFARATSDAFDWTSLLTDGDWLHLSGITPAIGARCAATASRAVAAAARFGVSVSFDGNYRSSMWAKRTDHAPAILRSLFDSSELLFADDRDFALVLEQQFSQSDPQERLREAVRAAFSAFPNLRRIATTVRRQHRVEHHELSASLFTRNAEYHTQPVDLPRIVDRIGAGDAFAAGLLLCIAQGKSDAEALEFGLAAACLKHGIPGDFNLSARADIEGLLAGRAFDVRR